MYPDEVAFNERELAKLIFTYTEAYRAIYKDIAGATDFGTANRKVILSQIEKELEGLGVDTQKFIEENIPQYYAAGADDAVAQLKKIYAPIDIKTGFNRFHKEAIAALVSETSAAFGEAISGVNRNVQTLMGNATKDIITQELATGVISGETRKKIQKEVVAALQDQGFTALKSKPYTTVNGTVVQQTWTLDRYAEMLVRTKSVEARNTGLTNRMVENGYDLVQVSKHGAKDYCKPWEGKILSITGETTEVEGIGKISTLKEATDAGLFHPNCKHALNVLHLELARETMAWNSQTRQYEKGIIQ